jgi:putative ATP-dependent endonuclease of OLD family
MATAKKASSVEQETAPRARIHRLTISNFRCIGQIPVTIELDEIVVLVGPNNAGKSSILRAYEVVMQSGSQGHLELDDFPNGVLPDGGSDVVPTIELETVLYAESKPPAVHWIDEKPSGERHVRERWTWKKPGAPKKVGFNVEKDCWDEEHGPWGAAGVAQVNRPEPHRIEAFDNPATQAAAIVSLLEEAIKQKVKEVTGSKSEEGQEKSAYEKLLDSVKTLRKEVAEDAATAIDDLRKSLNESLAEIFPGYAIALDATAEDDVEKTISLFKIAPSLRMGPNDGYQSSLERQGSGARRTLLWTALRILAEHKRLPAKKDGAVLERPHLLLLDEPEMCLHPNAIRDACNVLYSLPSTKKWQVMVTTHSPIFIDLSRDNTSIVRVERGTGGNVTGTTIYRPTKAKLSPDEKEELKLLNMYDPYVAEFFFGGRTVVVEGDTEHSAFKEIIQADNERFRDVHVVRARGKYTIIVLCKILNQFGNPYAVLHDADTPTIATKKGEAKNPAWAANQKIKDIADEAPCGAVVVASLPNFECAMFGKAAKGEKPYAAWEKVRKNEQCRAKITELLSFLVAGQGELPEGTLKWGRLDELKTAVVVYSKKLDVVDAAEAVEAAVAVAGEEVANPAAQSN